MDWGDLVPTEGRFIEMTAAEFKAALGKGLDLDREVVKAVDLTFVKGEGILDDKIAVFIIPAYKAITDADS